MDSDADVLTEDMLMAARTEENSTLWMTDYGTKRGCRVLSEEQAAEMLECPPPPIDILRQRPQACRGEEGMLSVSALTEWKT